MRQLLIHTPAGQGREVLRRSASFGATNAATLTAADLEGRVDVTVLHVPAYALGDVLDALDDIDDLRVAFSPENTLALHPPPEHADRQAIEPGNRAPLEILLDSLSSISSVRGFAGYTLLASVLVWIGLVNDTEYLLVAAMLIAPFAGPAINGALGAAHGDLWLLRQGVSRFVGGIGLMVAATAAMSVLAGLETETALMSEVARVPLTAVLLPLAGGAAAALHLVLSQRASLVTGAAVGTLVAAALAPSAGAAGMALAIANWSMAVDAIFELALQLGGILLSGAVLFRISGALGPRTALALRGRPWVFPTSIVLAAAVTVALVAAQLAGPGLQTDRDVQQARQTVRETVDDALGATYVDSNVRFAEHGPGGRRTLIVDVDAAGDADSADDANADALARDVQRAITESIDDAVPLVDVRLLAEP